VHLRAVQRLPGKRVVAIHDIDPRRAAALASEFGLRRSVVMDRQRLYENGRPQLVHVVTQPHVHQDIGWRRSHEGCMFSLRSRRL